MTATLLLFCVNNASRLKLDCWWIPLRILNYRSKIVYKASMKLRSRVTQKTCKTIVRTFKDSRFTSNMVLYDL